VKGTVLGIAVTCVMVAAAPAGAVVGGQPVAPESVPWFASIAGCGGTLVAPDRVLTAGHCVAHRSMKELEVIQVGGAYHETARVAMHPGWRHENGGNVLEDVAIIELDAPVTTVAPVTLGGVNASRATILGRGRSTVPGSGAGVEQTFDGALRNATL
jgi:secreted trypsin-like serine protease